MTDSAENLGPAPRRGEMALPMLLALTVFGVILVRTAWHCDDAYITFRTVDNFVNGYGLRWNTFERVQGYTHPLWMFLMSAVYFVTREIHVSSLIVSMTLALGAMALVLGKVSRSTTGAVLAFLGLIFSTAFVDFSTSGLENPLTIFLLALFVARYFATEDTPGQIFGLALIACLAMLNRMDTILFFAPALAWRLWRALSFRTIFMVALAFLPFVAWEAFSLIYYGFLTPNTAYAKLNTGIASLPMMKQGVGYFISTFTRDPFSMGFMACGLLAPLFTRDRAGAIITAGAALYLLYVVRIGGDFMMGRFFAAPVLVAAALVARAQWRASIAVPVYIAGATLLVAVPYPAAFQGEDYGQDRWNLGARPPHKYFLDHRYVKDERGLDYKITGLLRMRHFGWELDPADKWVISGKEYRARGGNQVHVHGAIGWRGFYAGPDTIILDWFALTEPLLARLPAKEQDKWLIGHFDRELPAGYKESVATGKNLIKDPGVAAYYDKLKLITQGPIWDRARWQAIYEMNLGKYEPLLAEYRAKYLKGK